LPFFDNPAQFLINFASEQRLTAGLDLPGGLDACCTASQEMQHKQYQSHNQGDMNEGGGYVKCEKPEQPKNDQNCGYHPKHFLSPRRRARRNL
jgi:hypothetical protein